MKDTIRILFTDLDGTLLNSAQEVSTANKHCLEELGRQGITRVISTGRSLFSFRKVIDPEFPVDYLIFSTGAGIFDMATQTLLHASNLEKPDILNILKYLVEHNIDFMVHHSVPENHCFTYSGDAQSSPDFRRRLLLYNSYAEKFISAESLPEQSAQIIAIFPAGELERFNAVRADLSSYQVTRTTSPLDGTSIWMEIFPNHVSKGLSAAWLMNYLQLEQENSLGIGNDYNDISLLEYTGVSYVVGNAPLELQQQYFLTSSNNKDGFSQAIREAMPNTYKD